MLQPLCTLGRVPSQNALRAHGVGPSWYRLPPVPESVSVARLFATGKFDEDEDAEFVGDVEVVASELMTNAINYAMKHGEPAKGTAPGLWLGVQTLKRWVHLYVRDPYPVPPVPRIAGVEDTSGRGLLIVRLLCARYWVEGRTFDKTSHAVLTKPGVELTEAEIEQLRK